jgi:hypothetical protein
VEALKNWEADQGEAGNQETMNQTRLAVTCTARGLLLVSWFLAQSPNFSEIP